MAHGHQNATRVTVALSLEQVTDLDEVFRARQVASGAVDTTRRPQQSEREALVLDLLLAAVEAELGE
jgi:hypothetical protein